jgi:uncharacterized RDD family membrane protein YckC
VAGLDRRFYAFVIDRLVGWTLIGAAGWAAYALFFRDDAVWGGVALVAGAVLLVWLLFAVALGASGATPGKAAVGLRVVGVGTGAPIGVGRALLRGLVLGVATIPTFGIGLATLAWTALMDPRRQRRGWHDHVARSVVVDVRPEPVAVDDAHSGPRHVVNLTAMRLVPAPPPVAPPEAPRRAQRPTPTTRPRRSARPTPIGVPVPALTARRPTAALPGVAPLAPRAIANSSQTSSTVPPTTATPGQSSSSRRKSSYAAQPAAATRPQPISRSTTNA